MSAPRKNKAKPGQLLARGFLNRKTGQAEVAFYAGEGIPEADFEAFRAHLSVSRPTIRHLIEAGYPPDLSLIEELTARGYDLRTFSFSLFHKRARAPVPKRVRLISTTPGRLISRWARVEFDAPDICTCWHRPSHRADSSLLASFFSLPVYLDWQPGERFTDFSSGKDFRREFEARRYDFRTLRVSVEHQNAKAYRAAEAS